MADNVDGTPSISTPSKRTFFSKFGKSWLGVIALAVLTTTCVYSNYLDYQKNIYTRLKSYPGEVSKTAKVDAIAYHRQIADLLARCDQAGQSFDMESYGNDNVGKYQSAEDVKQACGDIGVLSDKISNITIPRSLGYAIALSVGKYNYGCAVYPGSRYVAADDLQAGIKGNGDIAKLAQSRKESIEAQTYRRQCDSEFLAAVRQLGITSTDIAD